MSIPLIIDAQMRNRDSNRHANIIDVHHLHFSSRFAHAVIDRYKRIPAVRPLLFILCKSINEWLIMIKCSVTIKTLVQGAQIISLIKLIFRSSRCLTFFDEHQGFRTVWKVQRTFFQWKRTRDRWCKAHLRLWRGKHLCPIISLMFRLKSWRRRQWRW